MLTSPFDPASFVCVLVNVLLVMIRDVSGYSPSTSSSDTAPGISINKTTDASRRRVTGKGECLNVPSDRGRCENFGPQWVTALRGSLTHLIFG